MQIDLKKYLPVTTVPSSPFSWVGSPFSCDGWPSTFPCKDSTTTTAWVGLEVVSTPPFSVESEVLSTSPFRVGSEWVASEVVSSTTSPCVVSEWVAGVSFEGTN